MAVNFDEMLGNLTPKGNSISPDQFFDLIREAYEAIDDTSLLREARLLLESIDKVSIDAWNGVPELQLTELKWGAATPQAEAGEVSMDARTQLEGFLKKVGVGGNATMEAKLGALSAFFSKSTAKTRKGQTMAVTPTSLDRAKLSDKAAGSAEARENISRVMGYLTFYKTLTRILQNFNASAAGFTFESFVAVLLGGEQVPTGNQTIADLTAGNDMMISLKLLTDKAPNVKGSMKDLVNDMVGAGGATQKSEMKYIVCLKNLSGEGDEIEGEIKFYQFRFNKDNMMDFLTLSSGKKSKELFQLPKSTRGNSIDLSREVVADALQPYYSEEVDSEDDEDDFQQEMTSWWVDNYSGAYDSVAQKIKFFDEQHKESFKQFLSPSGRPGGGGSSGWKGKIKAWAAENFMPEGLDPQAAKKWKASNPPEVISAILTYEALDLEHKRLTKEFVLKRRSLKAQVKGGDIWMDTETSIQFLKRLSQEDPEQYNQALTKIRGYVTNLQWVINKNQIEVATSSLGQKAYIGRLFIGVAYVAEMVNMYRGMVNQDIFEIIKELKALTFYVHKFFSEGFERSNAEKVIESSEEINKRTKTVVDEGPDSESIQ